jgi:hypothetical protein
MCVQLIATCGSCLETVRRSATLATGNSVRNRVCDIRVTSHPPKLARPPTDRIGPDDASLTGLVAPRTVRRSLT